MRKLAFLLLEIIIGISIFGLLLFLGIDKFKTHINAHPDYTVSFKDVYGLSVGSPVRLMGIQVGNVTKLELLDSEIYVTFKIKDERVIIPDGSVASIQFARLAGSKSLEIIPKNKLFLGNKRIIYSKEPIRINSIMQVQTTIFENLLEFCRGILSFFSKNSIDSTTKNLQTTSEYMQESNQSMGDTLKNIKKSGTDIQKNTKDIKQFLDNQNKNIDSAYKSFNELANDKNLKNNVNNIQKTVEHLSTSINVSETDKKVSEITNNLNNFNRNVKNFNNHISKIKNRETDYVSRVNDSLQKTTENLQGMIDSTKKKFKRAEEKAKN